MTAFHIDSKRLPTWAQERRQETMTKSAEIVMLILLLIILAMKLFY